MGADPILVLVNGLDYFILTAFFLDALALEERDDVGTTQRERWKGSAARGGGRRRGGGSTATTASFANACPDGLIRCSAQGVLVKWNRARGVLQRQRHFRL